MALVERPRASGPARAFAIIQAYEELSVAFEQDHPRPEPDPDLEENDEGDSYCRVLSKEPGRIAAWLERRAEALDAS